MSYVVLWVEHDHAKIYNFKTEHPEIHTIKNPHHANHHDMQNKEHMKAYFQSLYNELKNSHALLLVGPGQAKKEFRSFLETHATKDFFNNIVGVETMDKVSDGEIKNLAQKFFHKFNLFQAQK